MGFRRPQKVYVLDFEDTELDGLTLKAGPCTLDEYWELQELAEPSGTESIGQMKADVLELAQRVGEKLISWDLETDDGHPVPLSVESFRKQDKEFQRLVIAAYIHGIRSIPRPLEQRSGSGEPSPEVELPMEVLSPSPSS